MYPRNAASPERIAVGAVVQISDGAVQTSGVSVSVRGQGGASGASAGTIAFDNGILEYTPTQGETDFTSFIVVAFKSGCIPVSQTIVTSASGTPGYAGVDWAKVTNPTTTLDLSGTTIAITQKVDVNTIKTQAVTCAAGVTVLASVGTAATSTAQTGDTYALANGANGFVALKADTAAIKVTTDKVVFTVANQVDCNVITKTGFVLSATGSAALTESYAADGAAMTLNQAIYQIWSLLAERNIASTTLTTLKLDGATTAMTFTLDDATTPAAQTRAT